MVEAAKANARRLGFEIEGRVGDAEHLPYDDGEFDLVVGHAVIHHIPDVELALREIAAGAAARRPVRHRGGADDRWATGTPDGWAG